jgi:N-acetylmuramoyl-L-alanine amidase CwlA
LGVAQPTAVGIINKMNTKEAITAVHGFIEADRIIQTLPWDYKGWHVGSGVKGSYNSCAIGIEICEPAGHTYNGGTMVGYNVKKNDVYFNKVYNNAVELFAKLCIAYDLNPLKDIVCHSEAHAIGYASNHSDVMQWFPKHGKSMNDFREDVKKKMKE